MRNRITFVGANKVFFIFTMLFLFFQLVLVGMTIIYGQDFIENNIYGILLINQYVLILVPVLVYVLANRLNIKSVFRLNSPGIIPSILIIIMSPFAYMVAAMLNTFVIYLLQFIGNIPSQSIPVPHSPRELAVGIFVIAVSPAICEELLHRGIMLSAYEKRGTMKALVYTSIFFGIFHFDITNLLGPIFLGLLIGYYVFKTNSIFAGMIAHFMNNAIAECIQYFFRKEIKPMDFIKLSGEELAGAIIYGIAGLIFLSLLLVLFRYATRKIYVFKPSISSVRNDIVSISSHWPIIVILGIYLLFMAIYLLSIIATRVSGF
ncbi:MAG: CPBP family intramembrane glutamic endopeptidase [Acetivibrionales bacterium]|jgi:membrane protease YdiL (CAAX protease family)